MEKLIVEGQTDIPSRMARGDVGVIGHVFVAAYSACAGVICVDVIMRCIAVCPYAWVRCRYGV